MPVSGPFVPINNCEGPASEFNTDGSALGTISDAGLFYENTTAIQVQHSNTQEATYAIQDNGGNALNLDLTSPQTKTIYLLLKDNLTVDTANLGNTIVLGDGTRRYGYSVGGNDGGGMELSGFWRSYKLDTSNIDTANPDVVFAGTGTLSLTTITQVGFGTLHAAKARGNVTNAFLDFIYYQNNNNYLLTFIGPQSSTTPDTLSDAAAADVAPNTAPYGIINEPFSGTFTIFGSVAFGSVAGSSGDTYFKTENESMIFLGDTMASGNFIFDLVGNAAVTNSFEAIGSSFISVPGLNGSRIVMDWSDANFDIINVSGCSFTNIGTQTWGANSATKYVRSTIFSGCDQISFNGTEVTNCTFNGSNSANGAILVDTASEVTNQTNLTFNAEVSGTPSGHAVQINATTGTFQFNNWTFTSGDFSTGTDANGGTTGDANAAVFCSASTGSITIEIVGGNTPSVYAPNGVTVTTVNNAAVSLTRLLGNTEISVLDAPSPYSWDGTGGQPSVTTITSTETVSANTFTGDNTNYYQINTGGTFVTIDAVGTAVFSTFPGVLSDTNATSPRLLADGDKIRVVVRDNADNPSLQLFDEFEVDADPTAPSTTSIITKTLSSGFTSVFGSTITGANSKTVTVEKVNAIYQFTTPFGNEIDILAYRTGSLPILNIGTIAETGNIPLLQSGDRNYRNPA